MRIIQAKNSLFSTEEMVKSAVMPPVSEGNGRENLGYATMLEWQEREARRGGLIHEIQLDRIYWVYFSLQLTFPR
jgi:hypothetical protein